METFKEVFDWMTAKVCGILSISKYSNVQLQWHYPDLYDEIEIFATTLPNNSHSPSHPFSGFVLNLNACTEAHRDRKDLKACMVLGIGEHDGGDLVLHEPGLVVPIHNGEMVLFFSHRITHFNLHFIGKRASIVLHSDSSGTDWVDDCNGWQDNNYMS
jgi:hypothetical protein